MPVEFPNSDTFHVVRPNCDHRRDRCTTRSRPLARAITTPYGMRTLPRRLYNELYFGVGPNAGVIVHHPNLGDVDLRGNTMANYYLEQSEGKFVPQG